MRSPARAAWFGPLVALAMAAVLTVVLLVGRGSSGPPGTEGATTTTEPAPVEVASDAPVHGSLAALVAASDLVVRAEVVATERGRVFGDPEDEGAIESRLVTLEISEVLVGPAGGATRLLVEEEGWLLDGSPLVVDGAAPSAVGDDGIWFLVDGGDPDLGAHVVVNAQGRYLLDGDGLRGAAGGDALVTALVAMGPDDLAAAVRAAG